MILLCPNVAMLMPARLADRDLSVDPSREQQQQHIASADYNEIPSGHIIIRSQPWRSLRGSGHSGLCVSFRADLFAIIRDFERPVCCVAWAIEVLQ